MSGELACFPLKIIANGFFFFHFLLSKVKILSNVKLHYHYIGRSFAKKQAYLGYNRVKVHFMFAVKQFLSEVGDILHG